MLKDAIDPMRHDMRVTRYAGGAAAAVFIITNESLREVIYVITFAVVADIDAAALRCSPSDENGHEE